MSWGQVTASGNTPAKLEKELNSASAAHFDERDYDELSDRGGRQQAKSAAKGARALVEAMELEGNVHATISGHVRLAHDHPVPAGVTISVLELEIPTPEPENDENSAENGEILPNSAENGEN